jgi:hypothetical protein
MIILPFILLPFVANCYGATDFVAPNRRVDRITHAESAMVRQLRSSAAVKVTPHGQTLPNCEGFVMATQDIQDTVIQDSVIGIYANFAAAQKGIEKLREEGFSALEISLIGRDPASHPEVREAAQYGDQTESGAMTGATVGGGLGALVGVTALTVTGIGPVIAAGAIATGITGAIVGGLIGAFQGWGIHEDYLKDYEEMVKAGRCLVVVQGNAEQVAKAYGTLNTTDAIEVQMHAKMSDDSPEIDDRPLPR